MENDLVRLEKENWLKILNSPVGWLNILGASASIISFFLGRHLISFILLLAVLLLLSYTCLRYALKARKRKRRLKTLLQTLKIHELLHDLIHAVRDNLTYQKLKRFEENPKTTDELIGIVIQSLFTLEACSQLMTGSNSSASIMLPDDYKKPEHIETAIRSFSATNARESFKTRLIVGQGLAGKAFQTGKSKWSKNFEQDSKFLGVREDWQEFYKSGISSPFRVSKEIHGILNLDCEEAEVIRREYCWLVQCIGDLIALIYQIQEFFNEGEKFK